MITDTTTVKRSFAASNSRFSNRNRNRNRNRIKEYTSITSSPSSLRLLLLVLLVSPPPPVLFFFFTFTTSLGPTVDAASRAYPRGCSHEPPSYYDYDSLQFPPSNLFIPIRSHEDYALLRRLGAGKFSDVFEAVEVSGSSLSSSSLSSSQHGGRAVWTEQPSHHGIKAVDDKALCVIKCLKPVSERKIKRELLVLSHVSKLPNLARLKAVVVSQQNGSSSSMLSASSSSFYDNDGKMPSIVLEHAGRNARWLCHGLGCDPTSSSFLTTSQSQVNNNINNKEGEQHEQPPYYLTEYEIKYYLCHLLVALDALHSRGIMHRDIKPRNILINRQWPPTPPNRTTLLPLPSSSTSTSTPPPPPLMLIDLGLADFYLPHQKYNVRVASRHYKAPELLLGNEYYDYGIDMWGVGCILAGLLLRREPLFRGRDNVDQLGKIVAILGSRDLYDYVKKYGLEIGSDVKRVIQKYSKRQNPTGKRKSWLSLLYSGSSGGGGSSSSSGNTKENATTQKSSGTPIPSPEGIDLLDQLLVYDHEKRLTAREAMMHPFFDNVRDLVAMEVQNRWVMEQKL